MNKTYTSFGLAAAVALLAITPALAQNNPEMHGNGMREGYRGGEMWGNGKGRGQMKPGVMGTVTGISGTTIYVSGHQGMGSSTPATTFTVDASNATVMKDRATSTVSAIATGDMIFAQGTITGTNVAATMIRDGKMMRGERAEDGKGGPNGAMMEMQGNGQPVTAGNVTAINGNSVTITNKSNVTYTVDVTNAKIMTGNTTGTVASIKVGDTLIVQGAVNGNSVTASTVMDSGAQGTQSPAQGGPNGEMRHIAPKREIMGAITGFFSHLFGF